MMWSSLACPDTDALRRFAERSLDTEQLKWVADHLLVCESCRNSLAQINSLQIAQQPRGDPAQRTSASAGDRLAETQLADDGRADIEDVDLSFLEPSGDQAALGRIGKYEVQGVIGRGGMGVVFEAYDSTLYRKVAVKVLAPALASSPKARRRFLREARAAAAINHPNVITIHAVDEQNGMPYLVMEYLAGSSLRDRIRRPPKLELLDVVRIAAQIVAGLAAAHAQGVIHRDIKPSNILLEEGIERVKIADFGLARAAMDLEDITTFGHGVGTPSYVAPEQVTGGTADARSDLFSLGCVLYAMVVGHSPFRGQLAVEVIRLVADHQPPPLARCDQRVPQCFSNLVDKLLAKDPRNRFQTAAEVAAELNVQLSLLNQLPSDHFPMVGQLQLARPTTRRKWYLRAAILAACAAAVVCGVALRPRREGRLPVTAPPGKPATSDSASGRPWRTLASVGKSDTADYHSLSEALAQIGPNAKITILDDAVYDEAVSLGDARFRGLHIEAPRHATLQSTRSTAPVLRVNGVSGVVISGLRLRASREQHALWLGGNAAGLQIENVECLHPAGAKCAVAVIEQLVGTSEEPAILRGCSFEDDYVGLAVLGRAESPVRWLRLEQCRFRMAAASVALTLEHGASDVLVSHCVFSGGGSSSGIHVDARSHNISIANNTFFQNTDWIALNPDAVAEHVEVRRNLVLESRFMLCQGTELERLVDVCLRDNCWELAAGADETQVRTVCAPRQPMDLLPVVSRDPQSEAFLRPRPGPPLTGTEEAGGGDYVGAMPPADDQQP